MQATSAMSNSARKNTWSMRWSVLCPRSLQPPTSHPQPSPIVPTRVHMGLAANVYAEQLAPRAHGWPLWEPEPTKEGEVLIGDVGYIHDGAFFRLFNVVLPQDDPVNEKGVPNDFVPLTFSSRLHAARDDYIDAGPLCSRSVQSFSIGGGAGVDSSETVYRFKCNKEQGALLVLKDQARKEAIMPNRTFVDYMRQHHESWCEFAQREGLDIPREDIVLVRGWVKTSEWAVAAFIERGQTHEVSFHGQFGQVAQAGFSLAVSESSVMSVETRSGPHRTPITPPGQTHSSTGKNVDRGTDKPCDQCIFLSCYKIKYRTFLPNKITAAADPEDLQDNQDDNMPGSSSPEVVSHPTPPKKSLDPVDDVLDYILRHSDADVAITSDGDIHELCNGDDWPEDLATFLMEHAPRIDVEDGTGMLSLEEAITRARRLEVEDDDVDPHPIQQLLLDDHDAEMEDVEGIPGSSNDIEQDTEVAPEGPPVEAEAGATLQEVQAATELPEIQVAQESSAVQESQDTHLPLEAQEAQKIEQPQEAQQSQDVQQPEESGQSQDPKGDTLPHDQETPAPQESEDVPDSEAALSDDDPQEGPSNLNLMRHTAPPRYKAPQNIRGGAILLRRNLHEARSIEWPHRVLMDPTTECGAVCSTAASSDGIYVAAGFEDCIVRVWNIQTGRLVHHLEGHRDNVWGTAFSADGRKLITGSADHTAIIWNAITGHEIRRLIGHDADIWTVLFSPDGTRVVTGSVDCKARLWDPQTGRCVEILNRHNAVVLSAAFTPDSTRLITAADEKVHIWDGKNGLDLMTLVGHGGVIWSMDVSSDGRRIVTGSEDHTCRVWSMETGDELVTIRDHTGPVWSVKFSPTDPAICSGSYDSTVVVSDSHTGSRLFQFHQRPSIVNDVAFTSAGDYLAVGCADGGVRILDARSGQFVAEVQGHLDKAKSTIFAEDGDSLVTSSDDGTIRVWSLLDMLRL